MKEKDLDKIEIAVSAFGLEKLWNPSLEIVGNKLAYFVDWLLERSIDKIRLSTKKENFRGIPRVAYFVGVDDFNGLPKYLSTSKTINVFSNYFGWNWPVDKRVQKEYFEKILPENKNDKFVDRGEFLNLLSLSVSLSKEEKGRVLDAWSNLTKGNIKDLFEIFNLEQKKFNELYKTHKDEVIKLIFTRQIEWGQFVLNDDIKGAEMFIMSTMFERLILPALDGSASFWQLMGSYLKNNLNNYRDASKAYYRATVLEPSNPYNWITQGYCFFKIKYFKEAIFCYEKTNEIKENFTSTFNLLELYLITEMNEKFEEIYNKSVELKKSKEYAFIYHLMEYLYFLIHKNKKLENNIKFLNEYIIEDKLHNWNLDDILDYVKKKDFEEKDSIIRLIRKLIAQTE